MQKKLALAAAIAGVLAAPQVFAASTVYGQVDIGVQIADPGAGYQGSDIFVNDYQGAGGSLLGFTSKEDLGGGMAALATVEMGFETDTGSLDNTANQLMQRQIFAGLTGGFGTVTAGRQYREAFIVGATSAYNYTAANIGPYILHTGQGVRQSNFIKYASPSFSGFTVVAGYGAGEGATAATENDKYTEFGAKYAAGPLRVGLVFGNDDGTTTAGSETDAVTLGGQYSFGPATVYALYTAWETENTAGAKTADLQSISLGLKYTVGNGDILATLGQRKNDLTSDADSMLLGVGYYHRLSKTVTVYTSYATMDNDTAAALPTLRLAANGGAPTAAGEDPNALSFGLRVNF